VNAYDDARVARAIEATGRKKLIFAGLSLEVCAAFPAMTAVSRGLDAYVAVDACGTFSETKHQVGILRMAQAGVVVSDYTTLMVEILKITRARRPVPSTEPWIWIGPSSSAKYQRTTRGNEASCGGLMTAMVAYALYQPKPSPGELLVRIRASSF